MEQEEMAKIIKEALAEKGYVVTINWIESSSYIGFDVDLNVCGRELYLGEMGKLPDE